jgi:hypothetical protein
VPILERQEILLAFDLIGQGATHSHRADPLYAIKRKKFGVPR